MSLPSFAGKLFPKRAAHLLHRATFGATKEQIDNFSNLTASQAVSQLFQNGVPDPVLPVDPKTGTEWFITGTTGASSGDGDLQEYFKGWFVAQMLSSGVDASTALAYGTREKIVFFIHTVLTTIQSKVDSSRSLYFQNQLFRRFAFDKLLGPKFTFKELTKKIVVDNAMLALLDGNLNVNGNPNENFAREFHELFTIGRGLEGTLPPVTDPGDYFLYKELDVQAAAKVFSGWDVDKTYSNIDADTQLPRGKVRGSSTNASSHDNTVKQFSDRFNNQTITPDPLLMQGNNATEESALDEISQLVEQVYAKAETPRNICRRIYRFFVYHDITQAIDDTIVAGMADTFIAGNYKLQPVLEELFQSQHFYDAAGGVDDDNFGGIIKSPLDLVTGTMKMFGLELPSMTGDPVKFYAQTADLLDKMKSMGLNFYEPYDVAGYDAFHQWPIYQRSWISTNYLTARYKLINTWVSENQDMPDMLSIDVVNFVKTKFDNGTASNARQLIIALAAYLLPLNENLTYDPAADDNAGLTAERMNYFLTAFLKNPEIDADPEGSWTFRWNNPVDPEVVQRQLQSLFNAMMQSPEYQLY